MSKIQNISKECLNRWGVDENTMNLSNKLGRYLSQLHENQKIGEILLCLIERFDYYTKARIDNLFRHFYSIIKNDLKLSHKKTIYCVIEDDEKLNSSNTFMEEFRIINKIPSDYGMRLEMLEIKDCDFIDNIIFVDDIIGSGKTVEDFFLPYLDLLKNVNIVIFCIVIMSDAKNRLDAFMSANSLKCTIISASENNKAFKPDYIFDNKLNETNKELLREFEITLWGNTNKYILGFNDSQALVSFFRNTPNNTLSSFWYSNNEWNALFPRNNDKPLFIKERNKARYNLKKMGRNNNGL